MLTFLTVHNIVYNITKYIHVQLLKQCDHS